MAHALDPCFFQCCCFISLSGTVQYLGHGQMRTTYALPDELMLKVGRNKKTSKLAQQTELQLSEDHLAFFSTIRVSGKAKF